jgi:hypothetical protein
MCFSLLFGFGVSSDELFWLVQVREDKERKDKETEKGL